MCQKRRFRTRLDAKIALASTGKINRGSERAKYEKRIYYCKPCHGYHLTSRA